METTEYKIDRTNAALFGLSKDSVGNVIQSLLQIKFNEQELAAILTVLGIVLKAAGLQGLQEFIHLLIRLEQQYVATKAPAPAANTASK